jgi:WD40 repeat protein
LARKAAAIRKQESIASWLHGVAYRTAMNARKMAARRRKREEKSSPRTPEQPISEAALHEIQAILHEEVQRLPRRCRTPFVLCCLEGKSRSDAARQLGWKDRSVTARLTEAKHLLRIRLTRRGVALSAALCAGALSRDEPVSAATIREVFRFSTGQPSAVSVGAKLLVTAVAPRSHWLLGLGILALVGVLTGGAGLAFLQGPQSPASGQAQTPKPVARKEIAPERTDRFGDPLPENALARLGTLRLRHGQGSNSLCFLPDGTSLIAGGGEAGPIRLWELPRGRELRRFQCESARPTWSIALAPDGKTLASGCGKAVMLWDMRSGQETTRLTGHENNVMAVAFSADGTQLASGSLDNTVRVWDVARHTQTHSIRTQIAVCDVTFSANGKELAFAELGGHARVVDLATGNEVMKLDGFAGKVMHIAFSPTDRILAASSVRDKNIQLWDVAGRKLIRELVGHEEGVWSLAFSPDGRTLASGGGLDQDCAVRIWDVSSGNEVHRISAHAYVVSGLGFSKDGTLLASSGGEGAIRIWDTATWAERSPQTNPHSWVLTSKYSPDGRLIALGSKLGTVDCFDARTRLLVRQFGNEPGGVVRVAFSPNGNLLASAGLQGAIRLWNVATGQEIGELKGHSGWVYIAISPDGRLLASAGQDKALRLWDLASRKEIRRIGEAECELHEVAFSPDGKTLASAAGDMNGRANNWKSSAARLFDVASGRLIRRWASPQEWLVETVAFSPDGRLLAAGGFRGPVVVWNVDTGKEYRRLVSDPSAATAFTRDLCFSADGKTLASANTDFTQSDGRGWSVTLWELATGKARTRFEGHADAVMTIAFAPDGRSLVSGSNDTTALIWDVTGSTTQRGAHVSISSAWDALGGSDAVKAFKAIWCLTTTPRETIAFLREHLRPVHREDAARIERLILDLDGDRFAIREKATQELQGLADLAEPALRRRLAAQPSLEAQRRIESMLQRLDPVTDPGRLRGLRAIEVLDHIGSREARALLEQLAGGAADSRLTQEAKAALVRR